MEIEIRKLEEELYRGHRFTLRYKTNAYGGGEWSPGRSPVAAERPSGREGRWRRTMVIQCQQ